MDQRLRLQQAGRIQLMLCLAAALGIFVFVNYGLGLPSGSGRTNELGLVLLLIAGIWLIFRRDIARYQYQISITMLGRARPEPGKEQHQIRAVELVGIGFSFLLGLTGLLLLILNMVFR